MSSRRRGAAALLLTAALLLATPAAAGAAGHTPDELGQNLAAARAVTAAYHNTDQAMADGYLPPAEGSVLDACITLPDAGMGVHWVNGDIFDGVPDVSAPEALVYEPTANGGLRLVALEYLVLQSEWDATHSSPPHLFGHEMHPVTIPTIPPFYALHAWIWKHNPDGMFVDFNPMVSCAHFE